MIWAQQIVCEWVSVFFFFLPVFITVKILTWPHSVIPNLPSHNTETGTLFMNTHFSILVSNLITSKGAFFLLLFVLEPPVWFVTGQSRAFSVLLVHRGRRFSRKAWIPSCPSRSARLSTMTAVAVAYAASRACAICLWKAAFPRATTGRLESQIRRAMASVSSSKHSSRTTLLTSPCSKASCAVIGRPVNNISIATWRKDDRVQDARWKKTKGLKFSRVEIHLSRNSSSNGHSWSRAEQADVHAGSREAWLVRRHGNIATGN